MTDEPKKLIEAHLEALAAQRRQAAGGVFEMGEPAKRTLLGEVQRVHGLIATQAPAEAEAFVPFVATAIEAAPEPVAATVPDKAETLRLALQAEVQRVEEPVNPVALEAAEGPSAWRMLWVRLAFSFGTVAVIGLAAFIIRLQIPPERAGQSFAKLSQAASEPVLALKPDAEAPRSNALAANDSPRPTPAMASAKRSLAAPGPAGAEALIAGSDRKEKAKDLLAATALAPAAEPAAKRIGVAESKLGEARQMPALTKIESAIAPAQPGGAAASAADFSEGGFKQRAMAAGMRRNFQSPPKPDVLASFRFVPQGDTVRLIDQDGSVYLGKGSSGDAPLRFSAGGNNVTLDQPVTVEATLIPGTNGAPAILRGQVSVGARRSWQFEAEGR